MYIRVPFSLLSLCKLTDLELPVLGKYANYYTVHEVSSLPCGFLSEGLQWRRVEKRSVSMCVKVTLPIEYTAAMPSLIFVCILSYNYI